MGETDLHRQVMLAIWHALSSTGGRVHSKELGLVLRAEGTWLRFVEPKTGRALPFPWEEAEVRQREAEARQREAEARRAAEAERDRLRAEIERLKRERGSERSDS